jgi:hypothetical protein
MLPQHGCECFQVVGRVHGAGRIAARSSAVRALAESPGQGARLARLGAGRGYARRIAQDDHPCLGVDRRGKVLWLEQEVVLRSRGQHDGSSSCEGALLGVADLCAHTGSRDNVSHS